MQEETIAVLEKQEEMISLFVEAVLVIMEASDLLSAGYCASSD